MRCTVVTVLSIRCGYGNRTRRSWLIRITISAGLSPGRACARGKRRLPTTSHYVSLPIKFLESSIKLAKPLGQLIYLFLNICNGYCRNKLYFRFGVAILSRTGGLSNCRKKISLLPGDIAFCDSIRDRLFAIKYRFCIGAVDCADQIQQANEYSFRFIQQLIRILSRLLAFLNSSAPCQPFLDIFKTSLTITAFSKCLR